MAEDTFWAIHAFEAENPDEITFNVGEPIVIIERDDQYGDGWWQVRRLFFLFEKSSQIKGTGKEHSRRGRPLS